MKFILKYGIDIIIVGNFIMGFYEYFTGNTEKACFMLLAAIFLMVQRIYYDLTKTD